LHTVGSVTYIADAKEESVTRLCQSLEDEHRVIEKVLDALEGEVTKVEEDGPVDHDFFLRTIAFVREFADGLHHQKEERLLFPKVTAAGVPEEGGPVGVMLTEHEHARELVRQMEQFAEAAASGDETARIIITSAGRSYVALLRAHIQKEDGVLFPMAEEILPEDVKEELESGFGEAEQEHPDRDSAHRAWAESL
jgi:hemerythrin-like domain-containing protein